MPKRVWAPLLVLLLFAGVVSNMLLAGEQLVTTRSSYGGPTWAWGAAYDLLDELHLEPTRSRAPITERSLARTQWIVAPRWADRDRREELRAVEQFASAGGTVVVIDSDDALWRALGFLPAGRDETDGDVTSEAPARQAKGSAQEVDLDVVQVSGTLSGKTRNVEVERHRAAYDPDPTRIVRARTAEGPHVLERAVGKGRIVAVAALRFLTNDRLARVDNSLLLVDLARAYGAPEFDERCHGFAHARSPWNALGASFLWLSGLALGLFTLVSIWHAQRWPLPVRLDDASPAPTLEVYTASLASLYRARGSRDPAAVFAAYRAGFLRRVQRALSGDRELSQARLQARLDHEARVFGRDGRWLSAEAAPASAGELMQAVAVLEQLGMAVERRKSMS